MAEADDDDAAMDEDGPEGGDDAEEGGDGPKKPAKLVKKGTMAATLKEAQDRGFGAGDDHGARKASSKAKEALSTPKKGRGAKKAAPKKGAAKDEDDAEEDADDHAAGGGKEEEEEEEEGEGEEKKATPSKLKKAGTMAATVKEAADRGFGAADGEPTERKASLRARAAIQTKKATPAKKPAAKKAKKKAADEEDDEPEEEEHEEQEDDEEEGGEEASPARLAKKGTMAATLEDAEGLGIGQKHGKRSAAKAANKAITGTRSSARKASAKK
ncbi:hypothetical protein HK101_006735, partial [Irineochytrium annulatum]